MKSRNLCGSATAYGNGRLLCFGCVTRSTQKWVRVDGRAYALSMQICFVTGARCSRSCRNACALTGRFLSLRQSRFLRIFWMLQWIMQLDRTGVVESSAGEILADEAYNAIRVDISHFTELQPDLSMHLDQAVSMFQPGLSNVNECLLRIEKLSVLKIIVAAHEREIERIKSTVSWRITKPLRFVANLFQSRANDD